MTGVRGKSGRRPTKSVEQHIKDGTFRWDRHGHLVEKETLRFKVPEKPGAVVRAGYRESLKWCRNERDERAVRNGYKFNEALAEYVCNFFRTFLRHSKGQWAGQPFEPTDWQRDNIIYPLFGWVDDAGLRRFRRTYIEIPKKNYKSTTAAGIGLYMLCADGEAGAEVFSLGADKDQARVVHNEAITMVEASEALKAGISINRTTGAITYSLANAVYRALSASPRGKHGINIHCAIADELHEWHGDELWNAIRYGMRARRQPLLFVITNAGDDMESVCRHQHDYAKAVIDGVEQDDRLLALICSATREDAEGELAAVRGGATELPVARKCNPGLGHIIAEADLVDDIKSALRTPSELPNLLRLTYSVWATGSDPWLDMRHWARCKTELGNLRWGGDTWEYRGPLVGHTAWAGLDMAKVLDFAALTLVFPDDDGIYAQLVAYWLPEATARERSHLASYLDWSGAGWVRLFDGEVMDYDGLETDIEQICGQFDVREIYYDPWQAEHMRQRLEARGLELVKFEQSARNFANPTEDYERLVTSGKLLHPGHPILNWQAGHVEVKSDPNRNKRPVKRKSGDYRTIDGIVGGIMALAGAMRGVEEQQSYYDGNDLEVA